ncbi:MAG: hypothetical protein EOR16_30770 [Mesorhizobium sp.]|uniref:amidohydrolase family protein n=1 Tax=Mesorhizobium sp. TaxID=1871066 RepID=UPI000FE9E7A5|nr:amidohydrolase family protein [Mesorhizobium sp.]RWI50273.1 MAG: hypothetical protein EOR16_30770 [Mesorhizobium sp.]
MIDYHAHLSPERTTLDMAARRFMPFPVPLPPGLTNLDFHFEEMDRCGISKRYISVPPIMYGYELPIAEQVAHVAALNDWLLLTVHHSRLRHTAVLPLSEPKEALRELERIARSGIRSVAIGTHVNGKALDEALPDELWSALAESTDFILMHPWQVRGAGVFDGYGLGNAIGNPVETTVAAARLVAAGILKRNPQLNILLSHGGGALPYLLGRINQAWTSSGVDRPAIVPAARQFLYDTVVFSPQQLRHLLDAVGIDRIVMGTDSPFDMSLSDPAGLIVSAGLDLDHFTQEAIPAVPPAAVRGQDANETL